VLVRLLDGIFHSVQVFQTPVFGHDHGEQMLGESHGFVLCALDDDFRKGREYEVRVRQRIDDRYGARYQKNVLQRPGISHVRASP
jgi:hypothetical protein